MPATRTQFGCGALFGDQDPKFAHVGTLKAEDGERGALIYRLLIHQLHDTLWRVIS